MAAYIDYTYYTSVYLGSAIASIDFPRLALRASEVIDRLTNNRAAPIISAGTDTSTIAKIKSATCAVAEKYQELEQSGWEDGVSSESVGGHSVTYGPGATSQLSAESKMSKVAKVHLASTFLMFPGFFDGEYGGVSQ